MEFVLIPAGTFLMGTPEPEPVDEEGFYAKIRTGVVVLVAAGGLLFGLLGIVLVRAFRKRQRPQYSLAWFLIMAVAAGIGLLGGLHWYFTARALADARNEYQAALVRYLSSEKEEKPAHEVTLTRAFYMGKYEVTQEQYVEGCLGWFWVTGEDEDYLWFRSYFNPSQFKGPDRPVDRVQCDEAERFCELVSEMTSSVARLPTEAEWERACRAGTKTAYCKGDAETDLDRAGWYMKNSGGKTHPVGQKIPNAWGLYDMHGNVNEYCADTFRTYKAEAVVDPQDERRFREEVSRGGCWASGPKTCRSAQRLSTSEDGLPYFIFGFRVVLEAPRTP